MPRTPRPNSFSVKPPAPVSAPPVDEALAGLFRREVRAVVWLLVRIVAVALLATLLRARIPGLGRFGPIVDAVAAALVLWPFFTARGRVFAWRIALGRSYVREERWSDAERALRPLRRTRNQVFDATGEGAYWLAVSLRGLGRADEAAAVFAHVAAGRRGGEWRDRARAEVERIGESHRP